MTALLIGLAVGACGGVVATLILCVDPLRREREVWRARIITEQMRTFAAHARLDTERYRRGEFKLPAIYAVPPPPPPEIHKEPAVEYRPF